MIHLATLALVAAPQSALLQLNGGSAPVQNALISDDGTHGLFVARGPFGGPVELYSWDLFSGAQSIPFNPQGASLPRLELVAMSRDGQRSVLRHDVPNGGFLPDSRGVIYDTSTGLTNLVGAGTSWAPTGMSDDGTVIVGRDGGSPAIWDGNGDITLLPMPPAPPGLNSAGVVDVTADGNRLLVQQRITGGDSRSHFWDATNGYTPIPSPEPTTTSWGATSMSRDGNVVLLDTFVPGGGNVVERSFLWNATTGAVQEVPRPASILFLRFRVSPDGSTVVGAGFVGPPGESPRLIQYDPATGTTEIETLAFVRWTPFPPRLSLSRDGSAVAAALTTNSFSGDSDLFRWESGTGSIARTTAGLAQPNSTGQPSTVFAFGSSVPANDNVRLEARGLPPGQFGIFVVSRETANVSVPGIGTLLLGGDIGRFTLPGQVLNSGPGGTIALQLPLDQIPQPSSLAVVAPGDVWHFQAWHRDMGAGGSSGFSERCSIRFY